MTDIIDNIDIILKELNSKNKRKTQTSLGEWMEQNNNLFRSMNEDKNEKEPYEVRFLISPQTKRMLDFIVNKYGTHKLEHLCKIYMIYSLCLNFNTDDKRKKIMMTPKQGEQI